MRAALRGKLPLKLGWSSCLFLQHFLAVRKPVDDGTEARSCACQSPTLALRLPSSVLFSVLFSPALQPRAPRVLHDRAILFPGSPFPFSRPLFSAYPRTPPHPARPPTYPSLPRTQSTPAITAGGARYLSATCSRTISCPPRSGFSLVTAVMPRLAAAAVRSKHYCSNGRRRFGCCRCSIRGRPCSCRIRRAARGRANASSFRHCDSAVGAAHFSHFFRTHVPAAHPRARLLGSARSATTRSTFRSTACPRTAGCTAPSKPCVNPAVPVPFPRILPSASSLPCP